MDRRSFLVAAAAGASAGVAGCLGSDGDGFTMPPPVDSPPAHVYLPTHSSAMGLVGVADAGPFRVGVAYSYPDRFWELTGRATYERPVESADEVHLMTTAWEPETGTVLPEIGLTVEISRDGDLVSQEAVYAMLSQRMGFHYGDNFALPGDGSYEVTVRVGGLRMARTGAFEGRLGEGASATVPFDYERSARDDLPRRTYPDAGRAGAIEPMTPEELPLPLAPRWSELPGNNVGSVATGAAVLTATVISGAERFGADRYLAVVARTPHNRLLLPAMGLHGRLTREGRTVFEGSLDRTVDPELGYHYGAAVDAQPGDELTLSVLTPPQAARHEGYETAFIDMPDRTLRI